MAFSFVGNLEEVDSIRTTSSTSSRNWRTGSLEFFVTEAMTWFRTRRCSNLIRSSMAGLYTQRKQQTQIPILHRNLLFVRSIQGHSGGSWIVESCCRFTKMERILVSCRKLFYRELDSTSRGHRRWKGQERRATDGSSSHLLTQQLTKPKKNTMI